MALWAGCGRHRCLCAACEACGAKPGTYGARLLAGLRSIAAEQAGRAGKGVFQAVRTERQDVHCLAEQGWVVLPVAGLVEGGERAGTGLIAVVDVVSVVYLAPCFSRLASRVALGARLSPNLALGRRRPEAGWCGQHVGGGAARIKVEIRAFCGLVGFEPGRGHRECATNVDTTTLPNVSIQWPVKSEHVPAGQWMRGARITICNISRGVCEKGGEGVQPMRMIYQGMFKMQAHVSSGVVMYIAAFKVSHSVDVDATTLPRKRARNVPAGRWNVTCMGSIWRENSLRTATTVNTPQTVSITSGAMERYTKVSTHPSCIVGVDV